MMRKEMASQPVSEGAAGQFKGVPFFFVGENSTKKRVESTVVESIQPKQEQGVGGGMWTLEMRVSKIRFGKNASEWEFQKEHLIRIKLEQKIEKISDNIFMIFLRDEIFFFKVSQNCKLYEGLGQFKMYFVPNLIRS